VGEDNPEDNWYIYHSDHLGSSSFLTDAAGNPTQHLQYLPFGENYIEQRATTDYYTPYIFSAKERDPETGYSYFGARYYDPNVSVWLSVDPMADKYPSMSAYMYCIGNPLILSDPDGADPGRSSGGIGLTFSSNLSGGFSIGVAMGVNYRQGNMMIGLNSSVRVYNYGLGTTHGSTGLYTTQVDATTSVSLTGGKGSGNPMPLNTFNNNSPTGVTNDFSDGSVSMATNLVLNSDGRDQVVGYLGARLGDVGLNFYNDVIPGLGDGNDRYWTGGGSFQMTSDLGLYMFGTDVFTGTRKGYNEFGEWASFLNNPAGGQWGTYDQDPANMLLNNGQTYSIFPSSSGVSINRQGGAQHMYSQNLIHDYLSRNYLFYSTAYQ
jgi:RHS repeat-associated protein